MKTRLGLKIFLDMKMRKIGNLKEGGVGGGGG